MMACEILFLNVGLFMVCLYMCLFIFCQSHASLSILDCSSRNLLYHWVTFVLFY